MSVFGDYPLMEGGNDTLLRPGPLFRKLPAPERERMAETFLGLFERMRAAHRAEPAFEAPVRELIAWAAAGEDIEVGVRTWRLELHRARVAGAGRSPADMRHGWRASALAGGPGCGAGCTSSAPDDALPYSTENGL